LEVGGLACTLSRRSSIDEVVQQLQATSDFWLRPTFSRQAAQSELGPCPAGAFVVRKSTVDGALVLTVREGGACVNKLIVNTTRGFKFKETEPASTIVALIARLVTDRLERQRIGLKVSLGMPAIPAELVAWHQANKQASALLLYLEHRAYMVLLPSYRGRPGAVPPPPPAAELRSCKTSLLHISQYQVAEKDILFRLS
jgi:hypothetical protein